MKSTVSKKDAIALGTQKFEVAMTYLDVELSFKETKLMLGNSAVSADRTHPFMKKNTLLREEAKGKKTPAERVLHLEDELLRREQFLGLYTLPPLGETEDVGEELLGDIQLYIPGRNIIACLAEAAKENNLGKFMKSGVVRCLQRHIPIQYEGPKHLFPRNGKPGLLGNRMYYDRRVVDVNGSKVMRVRPVLPGVVLRFTLIYDQNRVSSNYILALLQKTGEFLGFGEGRALGEFGLFKVTYSRETPVQLGKKHEPTWPERTTNSGVAQAA